MEQTKTDVMSAQDRLTRSVKDQMSSFLWAALEGQAERDAAMDALARAMQEINALRQQVTSLAVTCAAYEDTYGVITPPEVTALADDDPSELVERFNGLKRERINGLKRDRAKAEKGG